MTYEQAESLVAERLNDENAQHCMRVAATARLLAMLYGVDTDAARLAGLLHDWDREMPAAALLAAAGASEVTEEDRLVPYLLHARTGARSVAQALPGVQPEVLSAIEHHTVGSGDMSDLDKIVYIADMIEPERSYEGVEDLREAVGTLGLDELFALSYQHTLMYLVRSRKVIHPDTLKVWNEIVVRSER